MTLRSLTNNDGCVRVVEQGEVCANPCDDGTWGVNCTSRCDCHNGADCHHVDGRCLCLPGYLGDKVPPLTEFHLVFLLLFCSRTSHLLKCFVLVLSPFEGNRFYLVLPSFT